MPPSYGTTSRRALRYLLGSNKVKDIDSGFQALAEDADAKLGSAGKSIITAEEARTSTSFGLLTTPDQVQNIVVPTDGLIAIAFQGMWKESVDVHGQAAIFIGANQLQRVEFSPTSPTVQVAAINDRAANTYAPLFTSPNGLEPDIQRFGSNNVGAWAGDATTGQLIGGEVWPTGAPSDTIFAGGPCYVFVAAGTYTVSVQFRSITSGTVTAKNRKLWVWTLPF